MSSVAAIAGIPNEQVESFRRTAAPFYENFWNRLDEFLNNRKFSWLIPIVGVAAFVAAMLYANIYPAAGYVGMGIFFLLLVAYALADTLKAKQAEWITAPLGELLSSRFHMYETQYLIRDIIEQERRLNLTAEFVVEYLFKPLEEDKDLSPSNYILWMYPDFGLQDRKAVLMVKAGLVHRKHHA